MRRCPCVLNTKKGCTVCETEHYGNFLHPVPNWAAWLAILNPYAKMLRQRLRFRWCHVVQNVIQKRLQHLCRHQPLYSNVYTHAALCLHRNRHLKPQLMPNIRSSCHFQVYSENTVSVSLLFCSSYLQWRKHHLRHAIVLHSPGYFKYINWKIFFHQSPLLA